jgi:hypothetical protein
VSTAAQPPTIPLTRGMAVSILELCQARWAQTHGPPYEHVALLVASVYPDLVAKYPDCFGDPGKVTNSVLLEDRGFFATETDEYDAKTKEATCWIIGQVDASGESLTFKAVGHADAVAKFRDIVDKLIAQGATP